MARHKIRKKLGHSIRLKRKSLDLSQEDLASLIGISTKALSNIENGRSYPCLESSASIKSHTGLDCQKILIKCHKELLT